MRGAESARERLQASLVKLSRRSGATRSARGAAEPGQPEPGSHPLAQEVGPARELASAVLERLDRIEDRLADLQRPQRPIPATREIFAEWVRLRKWEEIPFGEFLRLRRSGLV